MKYKIYTKGASLLGSWAVSYKIDGIRLRNDKDEENLDG